MLIRARKVAVLVALVSMFMSAEAGAFCFSFGNNDNNRAPYNRYTMPYPPPYPVYPNAVMMPPAMPASAYSPVYPYPQALPYGLPAPRQSGW